MGISWNDARKRLQAAQNDVDCEDTAAYFAAAGLADVTLEEVVGAGADGKAETRNFKEDCKQCNGDCTCGKD